jgi:hypothetical protein
MFPSRSPSPAMPSAPGLPSMTPPAPTMPAAPEPQLWVALPGAAQPELKPVSACRALPPTTAAMTQDMSSGWSTLAALLPSTPAIPAAPAQPAAGISRGGFAAHAAPAGQAQASSVPRGAFAGVENASVTRRGEYINPGDYVARVCSAEYKNGRNGKTFVIVELQIIESSYSATDPGKQHCNQVGSNASIFVHKNDNFASNIKEIILAVSGFDAQGKPRDENEMVTQAECEALVSPEQPFAGALVYIEAREVDTRPTPSNPNGGKFTRTSWWPCPKQADGSPDLAKLRDIR